MLKRYATIAAVIATASTHAAAAMHGPAADLWHWIIAIVGGSFM